MSSQDSDTSAWTTRHDHHGNNHLEWLEDQIVSLVDQVDTFQSEKEHRHSLEDKNTKLSSKISSLEKWLEIEQTKRQAVEAELASLHSAVNELQKAPSRIKMEPKPEPGLLDHFLLHPKHKEFENALEAEKSERIEGIDILQQQLDQERVKLRRLEQKVYEAKELRDITIQVDTHVFPTCSVTKYNESIDVLLSLQAQPVPARTSFTMACASFKKIVCVEIPRVPKASLAKKLTKSEDEFVQHTKRKLASESQRLGPEPRNVRKRLRIDGPSVQAMLDGSP
ncbi:hypothetical protein BDZ89DRAFT_1146169 [Hymenopellis radicata]|nr:hypothetical protein BDZ89DRAFT_1146169 [Hymenopellis radicata]